MIKSAGIIRHQSFTRSFLLSCKNSNTNFSEMITNSSFDAFCKKTGIKAFGFARDSRTVHERYVWYLLIVTCTGLTFWDVYETVSTFIKTPTGTKIYFVHNNSLELGTPTMCVNFDAKQMNYGALNRLSDTEFLQFLTQFNHYVTRWNKSNLEQHNNVSQFLYLSTNLITEIIKIEHMLKEGDYNLSNWTFLTLTWLSKLEIQLREFGYFIGALLCTQMHMMIFQNTKELNKTWVTQTEEDYCLPERITWLGSFPEMTGKDHVCVQLPARFFQLTDTQTTTILQWNHEFLYKNGNFEREGDFISIDFSSSPLRLQSTENLLWIPPYTDYVVGTYVMSSHSRLNTRLSPCSTFQKDDCLMKCRNEFIQNNCECSPTFDLPNHGLKKCGSILKRSTVLLSALRNNSECSKIKAKFIPDPICEAECLSPCKNVVLAFYFLQGTADLAFNWSRVEIFADRFSFCVLTEIQLLTAKQFLAQLGGNLSFYLGASFLVLIHICSFWVSHCFAKQPCESTKSAIAISKTLKVQYIE